MFYCNSSGDAFNLTPWLSLTQRYSGNTIQVAAVLNTYHEYSDVLEIFNDKNTARLFIEWFLDRISKAGEAVITYEDFKTFLNQSEHYKVI